MCILSMLLLLHLTVQILIYIILIIHPYVKRFTSTSQMGTAFQHFAAYIQLPFPDDGSCMLPKHWKDSSHLAGVCKTFDMSEIPSHSGIFKFHLYLFICPTAKGFGDIILDPGPHSGRVDVYLNDGESLTLGTICDTFWTPENSAVVCRQLGFSDIGTSFASVSSTDFDIGTGPIGDFECFGTETHLSECIEYTEPFCDHSQDVVVYCQCE